MHGPGDPLRRKFLGIAASAVVCGTAASGGRSRDAWRFFRPDEAETVIAICARIIPTDEYPGAAAAGVVNYVDLQLCGPFRRLCKIYRHGLIAVNELSVWRFQKRFSQLAPEQQDEVLLAMERNETPPEIWDPELAAQFFGMMIKHTMQGYYGDPRHGGNRGAVSWRMLGIPVVPVRGRGRYGLKNKKRAAPAITQAPPVRG
ncbi:MAG TPA: gluconate 2-dehydrogenase subunit 3 family protein [Bryobacteraceae bacterium]|nr:gluconate 2-dehydrogenase subunit 3 family protein [Bryobacteraceae bacterium]